MDRFGLTRLILIDSYKPGTLQEVRLDGHTNLNGVNGAGKTTLLRLIPLFFGERPGRLVPKSRVTDSFAKHYLPNESSYIIFEYRRGKQICMVVIYASINEEGMSALAGQRAELTSQEKQKTQLENEKAEWDAKDIQYSIRLAEQRPIITDNLAREQRHYEQLTSEVQDINAQFTAIKADTEKGYAEQRHQFDKQIQEVKVMASQDEAKHRAGHDQVREQLRTVMRSSA